jgi:hypothetical protein
MRIIVCGGRYYDDDSRVQNVLNEYTADWFERGLVVVHGAARGADTLAAEAAKRLGYKAEEHPADWNLGRRAGPIRNQAMVAAGADLLIAFNGARGTADCVKRAERAGIPVRRVR